MTLSPFALAIFDSLTNSVNIDVLIFLDIFQNVEVLIERLQNIRSYKE